MLIHKFRYLYGVLSLVAHNLFSQDTLDTSPVAFTGSVEVYYCYDFSEPENHERPSFIYSHKRHNEINLNLGYLKAAYTTNKVRGNFALMAGNYAEYNLASEPVLLRIVYEANAGIRISQKHNLWIDAGIMPSHIGFESAHAPSCWILTRSILADNSPYYESGVKIGYTSANEKLYLSGMILNGWQRITRIPDNQTPAFGTQLSFKPNNKTTFNWSTYIGNELQDIVRWRFFNNFYVIHQATTSIGLIAGFDFGVQENVAMPWLYNTWMSPVIIVRYNATDKIRLAARGEFYSDPDEVIVTTGAQNGFQVFGASLNFDYLPTENSVIRIEGRTFSSKDPIFVQNGSPANENYSITTSLAINF